jgi:hypothetical protein
MANHPYNKTAIIETEWSELVREKWIEKLIEFIQVTRQSFGDINWNASPAIDQFMIEELLRNLKTVPKLIEEDRLRSFANYMKTEYFGSLDFEDIEVLSTIYANFKP